MNVFKHFNIGGSEPTNQPTNPHETDNGSSSNGKIITIGSTSVRILKKIGEGGYSFVFLAQETNSERRYALKRCIAVDQEALANIECEIDVLKTLTKLNHANLMKYVNHSSKNGPNGTREFYVLTEFCQNGSLIGEIQGYLDRGMLYPELKMATVLDQIFRGLYAMHSLPTPIAHRDMKLENVLIDSNNTYKLCDFGSTSTDNGIFTTSAEMSKQELIIQKRSTEMYRSPELCDLYRAKNNNWVISPKVDIWAVGNILYTLAYHTHPFEDGGYMAILSGRIVWPNQQPNSKFQKTYSPWVNYIISKCFTMNPNTRPSAEQMIQLIGHWAHYLKNGGAFLDQGIQEELRTWVPRIITDSNLTLTSENQPPSAARGAPNPSQPSTPQRVKNKLDLQEELKRLEKAQWEKVAQEENGRPVGPSSQGPGASSANARLINGPGPNGHQQQTPGQRPQQGLRGVAPQGGQRPPNSGILRPNDLTPSSSHQSQQLQRPQQGYNTQQQQQQRNGVKNASNSNPTSNNDGFDVDFDGAFDNLDFDSQTPTPSQSFHNSTPVQYGGFTQHQSVGGTGGSIFDDFPGSSLPTNNNNNTLTHSQSSLSRQNNNNNNNNTNNTSHQGTPTRGSRNLVPPSLPSTPQSSFSTLPTIQQPRTTQQPQHQQQQQQSKTLDDWGDFSVAFDNFVEDTPTNRNNSTQHSNNNNSRQLSRNNTPKANNNNSSGDLFETLDFNSFVSSPSHQSLASNPNNSFSNHNNNNTNNNNSNNNRQPVLRQNNSQSNSGVDHFAALSFSSSSNNNTNNQSQQQHQMNPYLNAAQGSTYNHSQQQQLQQQQQQQQKQQQQQPRRDMQPDFFSGAF